MFEVETEGVIHYVTKMIGRAAIPMTLSARRQIVRPAMTTLVILLAFTVVRAAPPDAAHMLRGDKTLVAWVAPADLTQRNVDVLTQDNMAGAFDGIIFGGPFPKKWMAGSDWFRRTERNQKDWPVETADAKTFVRIAITYKGNRDKEEGTFLVLYDAYSLPLR